MLHVAGSGNGHNPLAAASVPAPVSTAVKDQCEANGAAPRFADASPAADPDAGVLRDARAIYQTAAASGERLSQRTLARRLRGHGHRFPNQHLRGIALAIGLDPALRHASTQGR